MANPAEGFPRSFFCNLALLLFFLLSGATVPVFAIEGDAPSEVPVVPFLFQGKKGLILPKKEIHFGTVIRGSAPQGELDLKNTGESTIMIKEIKANCDCLSLTSLSGTQFRGGASGKVSVRLNTERVAFGEFVGTGFVTTDEQLLPTTLVTVTARIDEEIILFPSTIVFGADADGKQEKTVTVEPVKGGDAFKIDKIEADDKLLQVNLQQKGHGRYEIKVTPRALPGNLPALTQIILLTNAPITRRMPLFVKINRSGDMKATPAALDFGEMAEEARVSRKFIVTGIPAGRSISVYPLLGVGGKYCDHPDEILKATVVQKHPGQSEIQIDLLHRTDFHGTIHGKLIIVSDDPGLGEASFDFRAFFAAKR